MASESDLTWVSEAIQRGDFMVSRDVEGSMSEEFEPSELTFAVRESLDITGAFVVVAMLAEYPDEGADVVAVCSGHDAEHEAHEITRLLNANDHTVARYLSGAADTAAAPSRDAGAGS